MQIELPQSLTCWTDAPRCRRLNEHPLRAGKLYVLQGSRPGTKVLIVSGYADADGVAPDLPRLTKPFRSVDLAESLAALD